MIVSMIALLAAASAATLATLPHTAPPPDPATYPDLSTRDVVTVLVFGDSGVGAGFTPVAKAAADVCFSEARAAKCDLAVLLGDNVYEVGIAEPGEAAWAEAFAAPMAPFYARALGPERFRAWVVAGNHDWGRGFLDANRIEAAMRTTTHPANLAIGSMWQYPALAYAVPGLPPWLHLHGIDSELVVRGRGAGLVDATRAAMRATEGWDVVFAHHVPSSTGVHGASVAERDDEVWARVLQSLRPAGLSLVLAGHDHHQELLTTGTVPVVVQGNSSKGREVVPGSKYAGCSAWVRGGKPERGFAIATFREEAVTIEFFDGAGAPLHAAELRRDAILAKGPRIGTCPAEG